MSSSLGFNNNDVLKKTFKIRKSDVTPVFQCGQATHSNINIQCDITIPGDSVFSQNTKYTVHDKLWIYFSMTFFIASSSFLLFLALSMYDERKKFIVPSLIGVAIIIALVTWFRNMLSMNMFERDKLNYSRRLALVLYMLAGMCFFASSIAVMEKNSAIQFAASFIGSIIGWKAFVIIFEGIYKFPTRQQVAALIQILLLSGLWELRIFLMNSHFA